jgi:flagellar protein FliO/FliZ
MKSIPTICLTLPLPAMAADDALMLSAAEPLSSAYLVKLVFGLVVVLAMVFLFAWAMKKFSLVQSHGSGPIKLVSSIAVGQRERIALLQVGDEQVLIGLTPGRIEKLHEMKRCVQVADRENEAEDSSFRARLDQMMKKGRRDAAL